MESGLLPRNLYTAAVGHAAPCSTRRRPFAAIVKLGTSSLQVCSRSVFCSRNEILSSGAGVACLVDRSPMPSNAQLLRPHDGKFKTSFYRPAGIRSQAEAVDSYLSPKGKNKKGGIAHLELETGSRKKKTSFDGIFLLLLLNMTMFIADHWFKLRGMKMLYLYHDYPHWYQFITSTFCHASWSHLSSNLFFLYIFGKLVEEEEGSLAVWISYLVTGMGANLVSWLILPRTVISAGASGAVFGLFAISVLVKISFDWRKILEVLILGQFVVEKVMEAARASAQLTGNAFGPAANINHVAHLSGALVGVALIWLINQIPNLGDSQLKQSSHLKD